MRLESFGLAIRQNRYSVCLKLDEVLWIHLEGVAYRADVLVTKNRVGSLFDYIHHRMRHQHTDCLKTARARICPDQLVSRINKDLCRLPRAYNPFECNFRITARLGSFETHSNSKVTLARAHQ